MINDLPLGLPVGQGDDAVDSAEKREVVSTHSGQVRCELSELPPLQNGSLWPSSNKPIVEELVVEKPTVKFETSCIQVADKSQRT